METIDTLITPVLTSGALEGYHRARMEFTAHNAFGGRVSAEAIGAVDPDTCQASLIEIVE